MLDDVHQKILNSLQVCFTWPHCYPACRLCSLVTQLAGSNLLRLPSTDRPPSPVALHRHELAHKHNHTLLLTHPPQSMKGNAELFKKLGTAAAQWHDKLGGVHLVVRLDYPVLWMCFGWGDVVCFFLYRESMGWPGFLARALLTLCGLTDHTCHA